MTRSIRAPGWDRWTLAAALVCAALASAGRIALAQHVATAPAQAADGVDDERRVKAFDFDERRLGNYEDTPMYWQRLTGPGLPAYSAGRLDDQVGHTVPPAFLFTLKGGNIAYEYAQPDLVVAPNSDYLIEAYIRAEGLEYARALIACYLVNAAGERIPGSEQASAAVRSTTSDAEWQRVEIRLRVGAAGTCKLRLQLWVLQDYVLQDPDPAIVDPIIRQEVDARIWFDDITITRVPHLRLSFTNPGGIVKPGSEEALQLDVNNATLGVLTAELTVSDASGAKRLDKSYTLAPHAAEQYRIPLPALTPGLYVAEARLLADDGPVSDRTIRFAVLPELQRPAIPTPDIGIELGNTAGGDADGALELITNLGCGAVKLGLPTISVPQTDDETERLRQARDLSRRLTLAQVDTTGVIVSSGWAQSPQRAASTHHLLSTDENWADRVGPVLAYFGGHLSSWQLGFEPLELRQAQSWKAAALDRVRQTLERFAAVPPLLVPRSIFDDVPAAELLEPPSASEETAKLDNKAPPAEFALPRGCIASFWLPADLPARALPWHLATWFKASEDRVRNGPERWLSLGLECNAEIPAAQRLTDMARRIVLARAASPSRVYVPAPFELSTTGGQPAWQPTDAYVPLRTLLHYLGGRRVTAALALPHDAVGLLFSDGRQHTLVIWTWAEEAGDAAIELSIGARASAITLAGERLTLKPADTRVQIPLTPAPLIIENVNAALLLLEQSLKVEPAFIQISDPEPRPMLSLRNSYPAELAGTITVEPPTGWNVTPNPIRVLLGPGDTLSETLNFDVPTRQVAAEQILSMDVQLARPESVVLHFDVPIQVGLKDITITSSTRWDGGDLIVEQTLENSSARPVSFNAFCQPPQRPQLEGVFLNVPPGEKTVQTYRLPAATDLAGARLWVGIQEIGGRRALDQLVSIPR